MNGLLTFAAKYGIEVERSTVNKQPVTDLAKKMELYAPKKPEPTQKDYDDALALTLRKQAEVDKRKFRMYHRNNIVWGIKKK